MRTVRAPRGALLAAAAAVTAAVIPAHSAFAQISGLTAFYDFNNSSLTDNSGNGNTGVPSSPNPPTFTASGFEGVGLLTANGPSAASSPNNQFFTSPVDVRPADNASGGVTLGGWFNISSFSTGSTPIGIISDDSGGFFPTLDLDTRGSGGTLTWSAFNGGLGTGVVSSNVTPVDGQWVFAAVSYDFAAQSMAFYVDPGSAGMVTQTSSTAFNLASGGALTTTIGQNPNFDFAFNGTMDNVFFYGRPLSASEVSTIDKGGQSAILGSTTAPEPGSLALLATGGLSLVGFLARRRRTAV